MYVLVQRYVMQLCSLTRIVMTEKNIFIKKWFNFQSLIK